MRAHANEPELTPENDAERPPLALVQEPETSMSDDVKAAGNDTPEAAPARTRKVRTRAPKKDANGAKTTPKAAKKRTPTKRKPAKAKPAAPDAPRGMGRELRGVALGALAVLATLALVSFSPSDPALHGTGAATNWIGLGGARVADVLTASLGFGAFLVPAGLGLLAWRSFRPRPAAFGLVRALGVLLLGLSTAALLHVTLGTWAALPYPPGGLLGASLGGAVAAVLSRLGAGIVAASGVFAGGMLAFDQPLSPVVDRIAHALFTLRATLATKWAAHKAHQAARAEERAALAEARDAERAKQAEDHADAHARAVADAEDRGRQAARADAVSDRADQAPASGPARAPAASKRASTETPADKQADEAAPAVIVTERRVSASVVPDGVSVEAAPITLVDSEGSPVPIVRSAAAHDPAWLRDLDADGADDAAAEHAAPAQATPAARVQGGRAAPRTAHPRIDHTVPTDQGPAVQDAAPAVNDTVPSADAPPAPASAGPAAVSGLPAPAAVRAVREKAPGPVPFTDTHNPVAPRPSAGGTVPPGGPLPWQDSVVGAAPAASEPEVIEPDDGMAGSTALRDPSRQLDPRQVASAGAGAPDARKPRERAPAGITIVEREDESAVAQVVARAERESNPYDGSFQLPPLKLLNYDAPDRAPVDAAKLQALADKLVQKFRDFGIDGRVREVRPGPVVTMFEFVPAPGIKVSKIASLSDDIAMAMEAVHVRIVAPIPGKGAVGIEIPNTKREMVFLKELVADPDYRAKKEKLMMAIGKDIEGKTYFANLAEMPHVLISGTTGSGKSVSVNGMIVSMLYRATPDEVRFLMIDPKMLELSIYDGIPHLLLPPITDSTKAALALRWAVNEMERRYQLMSDMGVRNLDGYNDALKEAAAGERELPPEGEGGAWDKMPYIVVVIDEYADLIAVAGKDVEGYVSRLAQKARACGIHVMLATQRPSVDVITGVIKANFPTRMGFRLASSHDSKTIVNRPGAEKLLGKGDMLIMPPGTSNLTRLHGAFVSEKEIHRIVDFLKSQGQPQYNMDIIAPPPDEGGGGDDDDSRDAKYDEAVAVVARHQRCSTSWLQRQLGIGYNRAARLVEQLERDAVVGPILNSKGDREIYVQDI